MLKFQESFYCERDWEVRNKEREGFLNKIMNTNSAFVLPAISLLYKLQVNSFADGIRNIKAQKLAEKRYYLQSLLKKSA